jgi:hypothetical protein
MIKLITYNFLFFVLMFSSCKEPIKLDKTKLDAVYFVGKYQTNYMWEIEKITLKEDGFYDYVHGKENDTVIENAGKWNFGNGKYPSIFLSDYPNIRKDKVFEDEEDGNKVNFSLDVNTYYDSSLGDLEMLVIDGIGGEGFYTFIAG